MDESHDTSAPPSDDAPDRRLWGLVGAIVLIGFVVLVVSSSRRDTTPVGASGAMSGMSMPATRGSGAGMRMSVRDISGRALRVPDGGPGVVVFVEPRACAACARAVRAAARAVHGSRPARQLIVVSVDTASGRDALARFARTVDRPEARYVLDDRGALASMFRASSLSATAVYDARSRIVAHPRSAAQIRDALARAAT